MNNDNLQPFFAMGIAMLFGIAASVYVTSLDRRPTFKARWAPVDSIPYRSPYKGDKLKPIYAVPAVNTRVHEIAPGAECHWQRCKLT